MEHPRSPQTLGFEHIERTCEALQAARQHVEVIERWGRDLAKILTDGGRLLVAGNGGSAAQAQHLTAELVGRYQDDRPPFSAIALHAETSTLTALGNDYGMEMVFARSVQAHGRRGDQLLLLSTSGESPNLLRAVEAAQSLGIVTLALTGPGPNTLARICHESIAIAAPTTANVQEVHLAFLHMLCSAFDLAQASS